MIDNSNYEQLAYRLYQDSDDYIEQLVTLRKKRNIPDEELADALNVSLEQLHAFEHGEIDYYLALDYALEIGALVHHEVSDAEISDNQISSSSISTGFAFYEDQRGAMYGVGMVSYLLDKEGHPPARINIVSHNEAKVCSPISEKRIDRVNTGWGVLNGCVNAYCSFT